MGSSVQKRSNVFLDVLLFHIDAVDLFCGLFTWWYSSSHHVKDVFGHFNDTGVFRELLEIDSVRQPQRVPLPVLLSSVLQRNLGSSLASEQDQVLPVDEVDMVDRSVVPERLREVVKKSKWKFLMAFAIRGPTPPPPLMAQISRHFFTPLFFFCN